jgi:steroid 5-alpha reductase family enzyme
MLDISAWMLSLGAMLAMAFAAWLASVYRRDVSIVDSLWSLFFILGLSIYAWQSQASGPRTVAVMVMLFAWGLRLALHITVRNHGQPEDRRYRAIRERNQPHFWLKSLYIVFGLQAFLAWVVCLPAFAAVSGPAPLGPLDFVGMVVWATGMFFQVVGDHQLRRFQRSSNTQSAVLDTGLWRYSRHPNYFGEALVWWGLYLLALSAGAWWALIAPVLMTTLLLRVSGVSLLEKDIAERRPAYREYIRRTNAFWPGRPRTPLAEAGATLPDGGS